MFNSSNTLAEIQAILEKYAQVLKDGRSVAAATGFQWVAGNPSKTREMAEADLTGEERAQYNAWSL